MNGWAIALFVYGMFSIVTGLIYAAQGRRVLITYATPIVGAVQLGILWMAVAS